MATLPSLAVWVCVAAGGLSACSGLQPPIGVLRQIPPSAARAAHVDRGSPWLAPEAKSEDLLYVSDQRFSDVYIFSYPAAKLVGTLRGFNLPDGLCSDKHGDVFVTDLLDRKIFEYKHGGSKRTRTLSDGGYPEACSVDPSTGNLAVADFGSSGSPGDITVFQNARGAPVIYGDRTMISFRNCGYDDSGNLFADGQKYGNAPGLVELSIHAGKLKDIEFRQRFDADGSVQWDGQHMAIMGNSQKSIYRLAISGSNAKVIGRTVLTSPKYSLLFWKQSKMLILTYLPRHSKYTALGFWAYPDGGAPMKTIRQVVGAYGLTVSLAGRNKIK
jgi:hypothetical protein